MKLYEDNRIKNPNKDLYEFSDFEFDYLTKLISLNPRLKIEEILNKFNEVKADECVKGTSCGVACIDSTETCRIDEPTEIQKETTNALKSLLEDLGGGAKRLILKEGDNEAGGWLDDYKGIHELRIVNDKNGTKEDKEKNIKDIKNTLLDEIPENSKIILDINDQKSYGIKENGEFKEITKEEFDQTSGSQLESVGDTGKMIDLKEGNNEARGYFEVFDNIYEMGIIDDKNGTKEDKEKNIENIKNNLLTAIPENSKITLDINDEKTYGIKENGKFKELTKEEFDKNQKIDKKERKIVKNSKITKKQLKKLERREKEFRNKDVENGSLVDSNGKEHLFILGSENDEVSLNVSGLRDISDDIKRKSIMTHNHPSLKMKKGNDFEEVDGGSFSEADLLVTRFHNLKGIRAASKNYDHTLLTKEDGWEKVPKSLEEIAKDRNEIDTSEIDNKFEEEFNNKIKDLIAKKETSWLFSQEGVEYTKIHDENRFVETTHFIIEKLSEKYNLNYSRTKINDINNNSEINYLNKMANKINLDEDTLDKYWYESSQKLFDEIVESRQKIINNLIKSNKIQLSENKASKADECVKGTSCGVACIDPTETCRINIEGHPKNTLNSMKGLIDFLNKDITEFLPKKKKEKRKNN